MGNVANDEQRHIAFGVKILSDLVAEDPECKDAVAELLREALRYAVALFIPPNWDLSYIECFGSALEDLYEAGLSSLQSKLRAAGLSLEEHARRAAAAERAHPARAGRARHPPGPGRRPGREERAAGQDPETMALVFEAIGRSIDHRRAPGRTGHHPVGLHRRPAVAAADRQRLDERGPRAARRTPT